jgi:hypothetical protein
MMIMPAIRLIVSGPPPCYYISGPRFFRPFRLEEVILKRLLWILAAAVLLLSACDMSFITQDTDLTDEAALIEETTDLPGGAGHRVSWYIQEGHVLQYYEDHYVTDGKEVQIQRFSATNTLSYTYLMAYTGDNKTLLAYYSASNALVWYQAFTYTASNCVETIREYDAANALQWAGKYAYGSSAAPDKATVSATYASDFTLKAATITTFDATTGKPLEETSYALPEAAASIAEARSVSASGASPRALLALTAPTVPALPATWDLPDPATISLPVSGHSLWFYDPFGTTAVAFSAAWYPLSVKRSDDSRLTAPVTVDLSYDEQGRISGKTTRYGDVVALDATIEYEDASSFFPVRVDTTGRALYMPLVYDIAYDADHRPLTLTVSNADSVMARFDYEYAGPAVPTSVAALRSIDPFQFMDSLLTANLKIRQYDGDGILVETFNVVPVENGVKVEVIWPDGSQHGYYLALNDSSGQTISLAAYSAAGAQLWINSYGYAGAVEEAQAQFGRISEVIDVDLAGIGSMDGGSFLYDLLL